MPYYAIFSGTMFPNKQTQSLTYYTKLSPLLRKQSGLLEEINYFNANTCDTLLLSSWRDEKSLAKWQAEPTHLRIQHAARENVFESLRVRIGSEGLAVGEGEGNPVLSVVVLHQRPRTWPHPESAKEVVVDYGTLLRPGVDVSQIIDHLLDHSVWLTETSVLHITAWRSASQAEAFEDSLLRMPGDWLHRVAIEREYTKTKREYAPNQSPTSSM
jgi:heme-degrading monooxygenase HmoA